jgi:hypothetical protein
MGTAIFWMVFLVFQVSAIVFMTRMFMKVTIDVRDLESRTFINKAIYSPYGITLFDAETGRSHPQIIDFTKFNESYIESAVYNPDSFRIGIKLTLKNIDGYDIKTVFLNEESYFSDVYSTFEDRIVTIDYRDGRKEPGILQISVA